MNILQRESVMLHFPILLNETNSFLSTSHSNYGNDSFEFLPSSKLRNPARPLVVFQSNFEAQEIRCRS